MRVRHKLERSYISRVYKIEKKTILVENYMCVLLMDVP